jgi:hypothetical protein
VPFPVPSRPSTPHEPIRILSLEDALKEAADSGSLLDPFVDLLISLTLTIQRAPITVANSPVAAAKPAFSARLVLALAGVALEPDASLLWSIDQEAMTTARAPTPGISRWAASAPRTPATGAPPGTLDVVRGRCTATTGSFKLGGRARATFSTLGARERRLTPVPCGQVRSRALYGHG